MQTPTVSTPSVPSAPAPVVPEFPATVSIDPVHGPAYWLALRIRNQGGAANDPQVTEACALTIDAYAKTQIDDALASKDREIAELRATLADAETHWKIKADEMLDGVPMNADPDVFRLAWRIRHQGQPKSSKITAGCACLIDAFVKQKIDEATAPFRERLQELERIHLARKNFSHRDSSNQPQSTPQALQIAYEVRRGAHSQEEAAKLIDELAARRIGDAVKGLKSDLAVCQSALEAQDDDRAARINRIIELEKTLRDRDVTIQDLKDTVSQKLSANSALGQLTYDVMRCLGNPERWFHENEEFYHFVEHKMAQAVDSAMTAPSGDYSGSPRRDVGPV